MTSIARALGNSALSTWLCIACIGACGTASVPRPAAVQVVAADYVAVPFTPRSPPVEVVPARPAATGDLAWADGGWEWNGERYRWAPGAWVVVPAGAKRARWVVVRREIDGQLFFAPSSWRGRAGEPIDPPTPLARARTRPGGPAGAGGEQTEAPDPAAPSPTGSAVLDE